MRKSICMASNRCCSDICWQSIPEINRYGFNLGLADANESPANANTSIQRRYVTFPNYYHHAIPRWHVSSDVDARNYSTFQLLLDGKFDFQKRPLLKNKALTSLNSIRSISFGIEKYVNYLCISTTK